ncbi:phage Gp37/Gp68 family protein [Bacteroides graminisolvens]|uniref:phage Gp37/Gp68 family protein n=1 Tax=Bacteroides graminisolvens TaxID=477666 RepID=UPI0023F0CFA8|nr:phage Gp37/Gp68 family protein [Bacteroides graminisolvens]
MKTTKIEWTDKTWNPITGCTKISAGCANCYAEIMSKRLQAMKQDKYKNGFILTMHNDVLDEPIKWKKPHTIFVCSMSDLFHENVPFSFIDKVVETIKSTPQHNYQILTKRANRMAEYFSDKNIPKNAWLGVTVDIASSKSRIDFLRNLNAPIKFLSCEPLLEDLGDMNLDGIDWVIVGGESGAKARPMKEEWVQSIKVQTEKQGSAFFFKQWGTWGSDGIKRNKKANGKLINGKVYQAMPTLNIES